MNYKLAMIPFLLAGMLASCDDNEELVQQNPEFVESGYGALTLTLKFPDAQTKAVDDPVDVAYPEEKIIRSVAFFVKTGADETDPNLSGNFSGYFSDEDLLSTKGLQEDLTEKASGVYTAKIRHRSEGWTNPQVMVIANYVENGLSAKLKEIDDWDKLTSVVSETLTANPQTPLLMYSKKEIEAWKKTGGSNGGGPVDESFEMERLVSRIDIRNNAYNQTNPDQGFVLTSARLIRPKTVSYLMPNASGMPLEVSTVPFAISGTVVEEGTDPVIQKIDSLYAYENANGDKSTATAVQIDGTFRGGRISKVIDFKKPDEVGAEGAPIALARNHRYVVNLNAAPDSTDIEWDIVVKEWNESDTIKVKPAFNKPVLSDFNEVDMKGAQWNEATKTLDITNVSETGGTFTFKTLGTIGSVYEVAYAYDTDGSSIDGVLADIVKADKPIISYAASIETPFTINIPKQKDEEKVPLDIYVIIQNGGNLNACDTITIKSRPVYNGVTDAMPVLMKDGKYWAPINVGATATTNVAATSGDITAACGQLFQWGRYSGVNANSAGGDVYEESDRPVGTVEGALPDMTTWNGKHIKSSSSNPNTRNNWLQFKADEDNPASASMVAGAWYQQLWNGNEGKSDVVSKTVNDPCPQGWRVPTQAEWIAIGAGKSQADSGTSWDSSNLRLIVPGKEEGETLYLPAAGNRLNSSGASSGQGSIGYYWSSSVPAGSTNASYVYFSSGGTLNTNSYGRAYGYSVRCVQE